MLSMALLAAHYSLKDSNAMLDALFNNVTFSASWNHGKILAIGGKTMMTGGINCWNEYTAPHTSILDMQAKVTGDAAISAHGYADYFWKYLNKAHETDSRSFKKSIKLATPFDQVASAWKPDTVVPIFKDTVKFTPKSSGIKVLSVARLGDWHGNYIPDYPVQFVDGLRDLLVNVNAPAAIAAGDFKGLVRQIQTSNDTEGIMALLRTFNFSPAAWASRTIRVNAIANAKTSVYMSNQMIVGGLQKGNESYETVVETLNTGKAANQKWDGYLWPYGKLIAHRLRHKLIKNDQTSCSH
jgi:phosphatidylserine/phosphatidylglycerophosphate/cardiolipin synthase-like enzyme